MISLLLVSALLLSCLCMGVFAAGEYNGKTVLLYTGNLRGDVDVYAKIAALKTDYEAKGAEVVLVDAGNYLQGSTVANSDRGLSIVNLMDAVGYDVAALGQYELVYGPATTGYPYHSNFYRYYTQAELVNGAQELTYKQGYSESAPTVVRPMKEEATFRTVASNLTGTSSSYSFDASVPVTTQSGVSFVFYGLTAPSAPDAVQDSFLDGLTFSESLSLGEHAGSILVVLSNAADIEVDGALVISAPTDGAQLVGAYVIDNEGKTAAPEAIDLSTVTPDAEVSALAAAAKEAALEVLGVSEVMLNGADSANWNGETNLGDLTADALKWYAETHIDGLREGVELVAVQNGGNCDNFLYSGDITATDLLSALPFSPMGVGVLYLTGAQLLEALEAATQQDDCPGWAQVAGIEYTVRLYEEYDAGETYGNFFKADSIRRVSIETINGKAFDAAATYGIVADNFLINGNDTYYVFSEAKSGETYVNNGNGIKTRDIVARYIRDVLNGTIGEAYAAPQSRITVLETAPVVLPFTDIEEGRWYYEGVRYAYSNGYFNGITDTTFGPDESMTRAMLVTVLYRMEGSPTLSATTSAFTDLRAGSYYEKAVVWAATNKIVNGVSDTTFEPESNVTREQLAAILYRYAQYKNYPTPSTGSLSAFPDASAVSAYAQTAILWAVSNGVMNGSLEGSATLLQPKGNATRAQVATVLQRFDEKVAA